MYVYFDPKYDFHTDITVFTDLYTFSYDGFERKLFRQVRDDLFVVC